MWVLGRFEGEPLTELNGLGSASGVDAAKSEADMPAIIRFDGLCKVEVGEGKEVGSVAATRYARPCLPVNPLLMICEVSARSA